MTTDEIIRKVKAAIDELSNTGNELAGDENEANINNVIADKIPYALSWVLKNAPQDMIDSSMITSYSGGAGEGKLKATFGINNVVTVELPDTFLRVLSAKLSSWMYSPAPVSEFSETALMQQGRTTMGCPDMPVSVLRVENGKNVLKMYTAETDEDEVSVQIVNQPASTSSATDIGISGRIEKSFIYYIAYLTLLAFRDGSSQAFLAVAIDELKREQ